MSQPARRRATFAAALRVGACLASAAGCAAPVEWRDPTAVSSVPADARLLLDPGGLPRFVADSPSAAVASPSPTLCAGSLRVAPLARGTQPVLVAVWWEPRADGSAALLAAESMDRGRSWPTRAPVDTLDRATLGCARPAPALATDDATGYAHVAYALWAPEGPGVFFAHTMPGHFMFHTPVAGAYGDRPRRVAVAASGDRVAVAYEDPNARAPRVALALSRTQGHVFEQPGLEPVRTAALQPRVALRGRTIALAWTAGDDPNAGTLVRVGTIRE